MKNRHALNSRTAEPKPNAKASEDSEKPTAALMGVSREHVKRLGGKLAIVDKRRSDALQTKQENIIGGPVEGRVALMFAAMISTAGSICGASKLVKSEGAREIHVAATHGVFCGPARENLRNAPIDTMVVTDTIPLSDEQADSKIKVLTVAPLLAEAIKRIHHDQSVSEIFRPRPE